MAERALQFTQRSLAEALNNVRCMYDLGPELIAEEVFSAVAKQPAQAAPDGWKLLPVEPDERMLAAGRNRHLPQMMSGERLALLYRTMLAAAPAAPADVDDECVHEFVPFQAGCTKCGEPYAAAPAAPVAHPDDALAQRCAILEDDLRTLGDALQQATLIGVEAEKEREALRAEVADLKALLIDAERGAEELVQLRAESRELRGLLKECRPAVAGEVAKWQRLAYASGHRGGELTRGLLQRVDAALEARE